MLAIYNIGILFFSLVLRLVALFNSKANKLVRGRSETMQRIKKLNLKKNLFGYIVHH